MKFIIDKLLERDVPTISLWLAMCGSSILFAYTATGLTLILTGAAIDIALPGRK